MKNKNISFIYLLNKNILAIIENSDINFKIEIMNIKTKVILFDLCENCPDFFFLGYIRAEQIISLNEDNFLLIKKMRNGCGSRYYYLYESTEYIKTDDHTYINGNQIDISPSESIKVAKFIDNCFITLNYDSFKILYSYPDNCI